MTFIPEKADQSLSSLLNFAPENTLLEPLMSEACSPEGELIEQQRPLLPLSPAAGLLLPRQTT